MPMKKNILFSVLAVTLFLLSGKPSAASTWKSPYPPFTDDLTAGWNSNCILVNTPSEADATHVYTLNPDNTIQINQSYYTKWERNARCDEIQFHVDHNTPITRLNSWLDSVAYGWYANIGNTHFKNQTVSTSRHEWFYVDQSGIHRIPDILTAWSWGLLMEDRISIYSGHTDAFYKYAPLGAPLKFSEGRYVNKIHDIWKEEDRNFSTLPSRLASSIRNNTYGYSKIFSSCPSNCGSDTDRFCGNLLDWRWYQSNPGYYSCPTREELTEWRNDDSVWKY